MQRIIVILLMFLIMGLPLVNVRAEDLTGEKDGKFFKVRGGYHRHRLSLYKETLQKFEDSIRRPERDRRDPNPIDLRFDVGDTSNDTREASISFGYRRKNLALNLGAGQFGEVRTDLIWSDGGRGYAAFDAYFVDFTLRRYLMDAQNSPPKGLILYGEGGLGLYVCRWRFEDDRIGWIGEWRRVTEKYWEMEDGRRVEKTREVMWPKIYTNPKVESSDLGWHLGAGFEWFINPEFSVDLGAVYRWIYFENTWRFPRDFNLDWDTDVVGDPIESRDKEYQERRSVYFYDVTNRDRGLVLDLSGISASLGINYHF